MVSDKKLGLASNFTLARQPYARQIQLIAIHTKLSTNYRLVCKVHTILAEVLSSLGRRAIQCQLHRQLLFPSICSARSFHKVHARLHQEMLARAAKEHTSAPTWRSSQSHTLDNALKPVSSATTNAPSAPLYKNPLKRTASQASGGSQDISRNILSRSSSGLFVLLKSRIHLLTMTGMVGKLHDNVYFDENDFDDDDALDFNDTPANHSSSTVHYPSLPLPNSKKRPAPTPWPSSSQTIPWSSSPLHHHGNPPSNSTVPTAVKVEKDQTVTYPSLPDEPKISKRRTIPWLDKDGQDSSASSATQPIKEEPMGEKHASKSTPSSKAKPDTPYPWNKTASALKEEQKRLRQGHRKLVKDHEVDEKPKPTTTKALHKVPRVFLSDEQKKVFNLVTEERKSVFFTGSAGTGKSVLMREIIRGLRDKHKFEPERVAVTASTGLAACNVGGVTLHSFAGIGLGKEAVPELVKKIKRNAKTKKRWMRTKTLIVDEVSMVDGDLFDKLEAVARIIRNNGRPFGGIQLVITGDFFQLPPVPDYGKVAKFCFDAATWNTSIEHTIGLTKVFRQKDPGTSSITFE